MKHLFFDLDRTLWDFEANSEAALEFLFEEYNLGKHIRSFRTFHTTYKKVNAHCWHLYGKGKITKEVLRTIRFEETLFQFNCKDDELVQTLSTKYVEVSPYQTRIFPNTLETLDELKAAGHPLHIITNGFKEIQAIKLTNSGLIDYFDIILCSETVGKAKPHREVFDHALKMAGTTAENSIMIGDSYDADIVGAENAGMKAILFDPTLNYKDGMHQWRIQDLKQIPETLVWMR